ncbi:MAG: ribosome biogenesis GTPase Der [Chitinophagales bacterium]|nr:ribosome biogenesis GTPase Der [Chitinophagales bacterium]
MGFTVAIVGRPNVGKSTLFNRLIGERQAIVHDFSGVTRDRHYGICEWNGKIFNVIDTGGFVPRSEEVFEKAIRSQVQIAIDEASLLLFVVDITTGITDLDLEMANMLRRSPKKVLLVANKADNAERIYESSEFYALGFEELFPLSSISGSGTGELLDAVAKEISEEVNQEDESVPKIAIIGQPNVGKSSLLNAFVGEERNIVTNIAGTTRDSIHTRYKLFGKDLILVDTAGIRKKGKVHEDLEFYSVIRAIKSVDEADVCILVLDATVGIEAQDLTILAQAEKKKKGVVIAVNKWDLVENKTTMTSKEFEDRILEKTAPFRDIPILFISALDKTRIHRLLDMALEVYDNRKKRIPTSELNEVMLEAIERHHPPSIKGKLIKIKYVTQLPTPTPTFAFFTSNAKYVRSPYKNYLENRLREAFDFKGVPIIMVFREK